MNIQSSESVWLNGNAVCRIDHLIEVSGLSIEEVEDLIENELIAPTDQTTQPRSFALHYVLTVKTARRLRDDFQLDRHALVLALTLLQRISALENDLNAMQAKLGR